MGTLCKQNKQPVLPATLGTEEAKNRFTTIMTHIYSIT